MIAEGLAAWAQQLEPTEADVALADAARATGTHTAEMWEVEGRCRSS